MTPQEADPNRPEETVRPEERGFRRVLGPVLRGASQPLTLGILMVVVTIVVVFGGAKTLAWMESPDFCGRCHTMAPEVSEHAVSAHSKVECSQCHIGSGFKGICQNSGLERYRGILKGEKPTQFVSEGGRREARIRTLAAPEP